MHGVDRKRGVANGRISDAGQEESGKKVSIRKPRAKLLYHYLHAFVLRRLLDRPHDRLDLPSEPDHIRGNTRLVRRVRTERCKIAEVSQNQIARSYGGRLQELPSTRLF